jgi:hypothetical protein
MAFSPSDAAFEGFRLTRQRPLTVLLGWPLIFLIGLVLIGAAVFAAVGPDGFEDLQTASASASSDAAPAEMLAMLSRLGGLFMLLIPLAIVFSAMSYAAVFRAVLRPTEKGLFYYRLGGDELRIVLVSFVLFVILFAGIVLAAALVGGLSAIAGSAGGAAAAGLTGVVGGIACAAVLIWLSVRLCLALPITFAEKRIALFDSWGLTRGRFWPLLGMVLLVFVFTIVVSFLGGFVAQAAAAVAGGGLAVLGSLQNPDFTDLPPELLPSILLYLALNLVLASLQAAVAYAPLAAAYRALKDRT